ncbi:hypothetical protein BaRGS_00012234 [Batillaria attramentaria]|uniref:Uncharacterized protein n=1 Tax=Batillaria attramentaria TaxID=370345 RepID=A0ABD0LB33_9CAEN
MHTRHQVTAWFVKTDVGFQVTSSSQSPVPAAARAVEESSRNGWSHLPSPCELFHRSRLWDWNLPTGGSRP